jgi:hypothetical protein
MEAAMSEHLEYAWELSIALATVVLLALHF